MKHTHTVRAALEAALPAVEYYHHHEGAEELLNKVQLALSNPDPLLSELVDALASLAGAAAMSEIAFHPANVKARAIIDRLKGGVA